MNIKLEKFKAAVQALPALRQQFEQFCLTASTALSAAPQPASFTAQSDGTAEMLVLGQAFVVRFHVVTLDEPNGLYQVLAVLGVYLPRTGRDDVLLWRVFFDNHGNVKDSPSARAAMHSLRDPAFVERLLAEFSDSYFSRLIEQYVSPPAAAAPASP